MPPNSFNSKLFSTIAPDFESITEEPDALLAKELNRLSMQEREKVLYDVHGVAEVMPEGSEFVSTRLIQLELEIAKITEKAAYNQALMQDPNFVKNRNFRIRFLRAERFVAAEAAVRMVRHFQYKMELFGAGKLVKDIKIEDLDSEDIKVLESGFIQLLPVRDRAGRAVMCWNPILRGYNGIEQKLRAIWYVTMVATEDIDTQRRGIVLVFYKTGPNQTHKGRSGSWRLPKLTFALPGRAVACHFCFDDKKFNPVLSLVLLSLEKSLRARAKIHHVNGSHTEMQYELLTYGIPMNFFPHNLDGEPLLDEHRKWIQQRRKKEKTIQKSVTERIIILPGPYDVLFGREKMAQEHPGNFRYLRILDEHRDRYDSVPKDGKTDVAVAVVEKVKSSSGRFLKIDGAGWVEVDDRTARLKVSMAFRSKRRASQMLTKKRTNNDDSRRRSRDASNEEASGEDNDSSDPDRGMKKVDSDFEGNEPSAVESRYSKEVEGNDLADSKRAKVGKAPNSPKATGGLGKHGGVSLFSKK